MYSKGSVKGNKDNEALLFSARAMPHFNRRSQIIAPNRIHSPAYSR